MYILRWICVFEILKVISQKLSKITVTYNSDARSPEDLKIYTLFLLLHLKHAILVKSIFYFAGATSRATPV